MRKKVLMVPVWSGALAVTVLFSGSIPQTTYAQAGTIQSSVSALSSFQAAPGVKHTSAQFADQNQAPQSVHRMEINPKEAKIAIKAVSSKNEVSGGETVGYMIKEQEALGHQVIGAVNGDFFSSVGVPSGLQITDGEIITSTRTIKTMLYQLPEGSVHLEDSVTMTATVSTKQGETLAIDMVNRTRIPSHANYAFLFTERFGSSTRSPDNGIEVLLQTQKEKLQPGKKVKGTVVDIREAGNTPIGQGQFVLSATGPKADWVKQQVAAGDTLDIEVSYDKGVNKARQVLSGNSTGGVVLLKNGEIPAAILDPSVADNVAVHPRTMLGTKADGTLLVVEVDGRQPGFATGMTYVEQAAYLQSLGAVNAINIDGGGSSTYYVREPGDVHPTLQNRPSDGAERPVGNSLMILANSQPSVLAKLVLGPAKGVQLTPGSHTTLTVKGQDRFLNGVEVPASSVTWSVEGAVGTVDASGTFTAGVQPGTGKIIVRQGQLEASIPVVVTEQVARIELAPGDFVAEAGSSTPMRLTAYDANGLPILLSAEQAEWGVKGEVGTIGMDGVLRAGSTDAYGHVTVAYKDFTASAAVHVGPSPIIESFESLDHISASEVRAVPGSVKLTLANDPVRVGQTAGKLVYDFTETTGTSAAYVNLLDENGKVGRPLEGRPERIGMWVYADGGMHQLRLGITNGDGVNQLWNFTSVGGTNWKNGWRYVSLEVPQDAVFPIKLRNIAMEEKNVNNKQAGVVYYDNLTAEY
ncbi:hypothetical protein J31TS4_03130 [Paenibacillus sp. J31TS4]|uniref:phosphodiester glycosidase family protein n=1 Tax=Paenibacillus sp. J31TS4 TaxID=2807195 RepID=UPI001B190B18|nr:phosphodiester glycosidase family protein [Paenibacillus sp. J31TS4]GIP37033.1 hypothetical protein J31TS4_03130 [Paenibacillus sp. J31TS4]